MFISTQVIFSSFPLFWTLANDFYLFFITTAGRVFVFMFIQFRSYGFTADDDPLSVYSLPIFLNLCKRSLFFVFVQGRKFFS